PAAWWRWRSRCRRTRSCGGGTWIPVAARRRWRASMITHSPTDPVAAASAATRSRTGAIGAHAAGTRRRPWWDRAGPAGDAGSRLKPLLQNAGGGARGRTRTGMTARSRDFRTTSAFAAGRGRSWSGARLHHGADARQVPAVCSLHLPRWTGAWLGVGAGGRPRAFAEFDGCHPRRFPRGAQSFKSLVSTSSTTRAWPATRIPRRDGGLG